MKSVLLTVLAIALVLQLATAAPFICGEIGVATLGDLPPGVNCPAHYTCSIQCKCPQPTRYMDIQTSPAWSENQSMQKLWRKHCYNKKCTCTQFYQLLGTSLEQIQFQTTNVCGCGKGMTSSSPKRITNGLEVEKAESLEVRAAELEKNALQLESQAESLELE
jgi:hypothetical protein